METTVWVEIWGKDFSERVWRGINRREKENLEQERGKTKGLSEIGGKDKNLEHDSGRQKEGASIFSHTHWSSLKSASSSAKSEML